DRPLTRHRTESHAAPALFDEGEARDPVEIHQRGRARETEIQQRHEALAAGQHLGVAAVAAQQRQRLVDGPRRVVLELRRFHCSGVLEAGLDRGWPEIGATRLRSPDFGSAPEATRLRSPDSCAAPGATRLRSPDFGSAPETTRLASLARARSMIVHNLVGVIGRSLILMPSGARASLTAF